MVRVEPRSLFFADPPPHCSEDPKDTQLRKYQEEIAKLKAALEGKV